MCFAMSFNRLSHFKKSDVRLALCSASGVQRSPPWRAFSSWTMSSKSPSKHFETKWKSFKIIQSLLFQHANPPLPLFIEAFHVPLGLKAYSLHLTYTSTSTSTSTYTKYFYFYSLNYFSFTLRFALKEISISSLRLLLKSLPLVLVLQRLLLFILPGLFHEHLHLRDLIFIAAGVRNASGLLRQLQPQRLKRSFSKLSKLSKLSITST